MDKEKAIETAYNWIEKTFLDNLIYSNGYTHIKYNLGVEMDLNNHQVDIHVCRPENIEFASKLNMPHTAIQIFFEKKSKNSGIFSFEMENFSLEKMELILELYESILQRHSVEKNPTFLRLGNTWVRGLINDGWFIYNKKEKEFWFFIPEFKVLNKKIENETGSFTIEVSLSNFERMDEARVIYQTKEKYPNEPEIMKWIVEQIILGKKPRKLNKIQHKSYLNRIFHLLSRLYYKFFN